MRIAFCANGQSPHTQRWANGVCDRGHDVALVWMKSEFTSSQLSSFRPSISHHRVPDPPSRRRLWELPVARFEARRLAAELRPDLVHGLYLTWHGWTAHDFGVRPFVLSALGSDVLDLDPRGDGGRVLDRLSARYVARRTHNAVANSDLVLADSVSLAETLRRRVPGTQVEIVRFGVEIREATSGGRTRWRNRLGIDEDAFVLLSSRLVRPSYNIDTIIRALPAIRDRCPGAVLVLKELPRFSDAEYRQTCMSLAHSLGVEDAVRVVGELDSGELAELYSAADVYVSVPTTDGTAVSVFEAMAAGVAVVATDAPGIDPAILADEQSALLVPVRDPDALATAVADLGMDPARKRRLAERAFEIVRRDGDFNRELDRAVRLYEDLLEAASRQRQRGSLAPGAAGKT